MNQKTTPDTQLKKNSKKPDGFPVISKEKNISAGSKTTLFPGVHTGEHRLTIKGYSLRKGNWKRYFLLVTNGITSVEGFKTFDGAITFLNYVNTLRQDFKQN